jgi:hypothetical protein
MKDIDKLLTQHKPQPKRELTPAFAAATIEQIKERKTQRKTWFKRLSSHRPAFKTSFALLLLAVTTGGTAAALTLWPRAEVDKLYTKALPNGSQMIAIGSKNCRWGDQNVILNPSKKDYTYYEIRKGASVSVDELISSVKAACEEDNNYAVTYTLIQKLPKHDAMNTVAHKVEAIDGDSVTVSLDPHYNSKMYLRRDHVTYRFAKGAAAYDGYNKASLQDIKKGDTIVMVGRDISGRSSEEPGNNSPWTQHPENIRLLYVVKVPPLSGDPSIFTSAFAVDIVRLEPCTTDPSGFCRAYDFVP